MNYGRPIYWKLDGHTPVAAENALDFARSLEAREGGNRVALDTTPNGTEVSTVFLGIDHSFGRGDGPILFETMIFGGPHDRFQERYATWDEAIAGHAKALALALADDSPVAAREVGEPQPPSSGGGADCG